MKRRDFIAALGGAAVWPLAARAQQRAMPVIGFLRSTPAAPFANLTSSFLAGLNEAGFVDGKNVAITYRFANNERDRLQAFAAELVSLRVDVIVCNGDAAVAAKEATTEIPIVFATGEDPVRQGLVTNLARPNGNLTGVTFLGGGELGAKRIELLRDLLPNVVTIGILMDPNYSGAENEVSDAQTAARALGRKVIVVKAANESEFDDAFAQFAKEGAGAVLVAGGSVFVSKRQMLVELAARRALPVIYSNRAFVAAGGLISFAASNVSAFRQVGIYAGRILKGAKPSELPVLLPTTFQLVVNLKTAKSLGITVPPSIHLRADEVIE